MSLLIIYSKLGDLWESVDYKMNHFAIKEKIYIEALKVAYQKVEELMVA